MVKLLRISYEAVDSPVAQGIDFNGDGITDRLMQETFSVEIEPRDEEEIRKGLDFSTYGLGPLPIKEGETYYQFHAEFGDGEGGFYQNRFSGPGYIFENSPNYNGEVEELGEQVPPQDVAWYHTGDGEPYRLSTNGSAGDALIHVESGRQCGLLASGYSSTRDKKCGLYGCTSKWPTISFDVSSDLYSNTGDDTLQKVIQKVIAEFMQPEFACIIYTGNDMPPYELYVFTPADIGPAGHEKSKLVRGTYP